MGNSVPVHEIVGRTKNLAVAEAMVRFGSEATVLKVKPGDNECVLSVCERKPEGVPFKVIQEALNNSTPIRAGGRIHNENVCVSNIMELVRSKRGLGVYEPVKNDGPEIFEQLLGMGFQYEFARDVQDKLFQMGGEPTFKDALDYIDSQMPLMGSDPISKGGWFSFMGPTGVGKTTTLSKIASLVSRVFGKENIAIVTVDTYRIGAAHQLKEVASCIGIDFYVCETPAELREISIRLSSKKLVLLDTAGKSQKDKLLHEQLKLFLKGDIKNFLVMQAGGQYGLLDSTIEAFSENEVHGIVYTKLDEVTKLGEPIQALCKHKIPVCYLTTGQSVPADILQVKPQTMLKYACQLVGIKFDQERD